MIESIAPTGIAPIATPESDMAPARGVKPTAEVREFDFGALLGDMYASTANSVKTAEATSIAGIKGKASVQQVVEAVMNAEQSLQTAIAVRDKVVTAYLEISRMQI